MFGTNKGEVTSEGKKIHNEEFEWNYFHGGEFLM
jgi:hypothetical protein